MTTVWDLVVQLVTLPFYFPHLFIPMALAFLALALLIGRNP
jgi:ABC-type sulfate transport system permease component